MNYIRITCLILMLHMVHSKDIDWYKSSMSSQVVPPYVVAYTTLQNQILDPLLKADIIELNSKPEKVNALAQQLSCGVDKMGESITQSYNASETIRPVIDEEIFNLVMSVSSKETEVSNKQGEITSLNIQIGQVQQQVTIAEQAVRDKEGAVNQADRDVREAEDAVRKARERCITGRRRKRFLGFIKDIIKLPEKLVCQVFNSGGIDNAKTRRSSAQQQLANARQQLAHYQQQLATLKSEHTNRNNQLSQLNIQLQSLLNTLATLRQENSLVSGINNDLRQVITHLASLFTASAVLDEVMKQLIDFNLLIVPLNGIYNILTNNGLATIGQQISADTITRIQTGLNELVTLLPKVPLLMDGTSGCSANLFY